MALARRSVEASADFSARIDPICFAVSEVATFFATFAAAGTTFFNIGMNLVPIQARKLPRPPPLCKGTLLHRSCLI